MAKAKRTTPRTQTQDQSQPAPRLTLAGLQRQIDELAAQVLATHNDAAISDAAIREQLVLVQKTLEKFGGEDGQIALAIAQAKEIEARINARTKTRWIDWLPVALLAAVVAFNVVSQRGCDRSPAPRPQPDGNEQIDDTSAVKKLTGMVVFIHDRDPLSAAEAKILQQAEDLAEKDSSFQFRSYDSERDKSERVAAYKQAAKSKGIDPPLMVHIDGDKQSFTRMAKTWSDVVKAFGK